MVLAFLVVTLVVAVAYALVRYGLPLISAAIDPTALRRSDRLSVILDLAFAAVVLGGGVVWGLAALWLVDLSVAEVRGSAPFLPFAGPLRPVLLRAVGAVSLLVIQPTRAISSGPASAAAAVMPIGGQDEGHPGEQELPVLPDLTSPTHDPKWVIAGPRDSWVALAERHLGNWRRWEEVKDATAGLSRPDGSHVGDGQVSDPVPGQVVLLPPDANAASEGPPPLPVKPTAVDKLAGHSGNAAAKPAPDEPDGVERPQPAAPQTVHVVERNESFWKISEERLAELSGHAPSDAEIAAYMDVMVEQNRHRLADPRNPGLIFPAQELLEPALPLGAESSDPPRATSATSDADPADVASWAHPTPDEEADDAFARPEDPAAPRNDQVERGVEPERQDPVSGATSSGDDGPPDSAIGPRQLPETAVSDDDRGGVVRLPSGSEVAIGFALGVASAAALGRINRRRAYRAHPPRADVAGEPPMPEPLRTLLRAAHEEQRSTQPAIADEVHAAPPDTSETTLLGPVRLVGGAQLEVARAFLVARMLAGNRPCRVVIEREIAEALFGHLEFSVPGLDVVTTPAATLDEGEVERARRLRVLGDAVDLAEYRTGDGDELLDDVLLVGTATTSDVGRWVPLAIAGSRLGISSILLGGEDPGLLTLDVDSMRLDKLQLVDAVAVLAEVASAQQESLEPVRRHEAPSLSEELEPHPGVSAPAVTVHVLGPTEIAVDGEATFGGLRNAGRELLAFLVLHRGGQRRDAIIDELWPDLGFDQSKNAFRNALKSLREDVRRAVGRDDEPVVVSAVVETAKAAGSVYQLQPGLFDCDLWVLQAAIREAELAATDEERVAALKRALAAYGGEFVDGSGSMWVIAEREALRRTALDVAVAIAEFAEQHDNLEAALAAVERAIELDVYAEDLYVRGVRLLAALGRIESARELAAALQVQLADLPSGPSPMPATSEAIGRAISDAERRRAARTAFDRLADEAV
jgi:DNA-binding SARP family transcriptional activator